MNATRIKIRGIYSTALTKCVRDAGYAIVQPSTAVQERFGLEPREEPYQVLIQDREDLQGVELAGLPERVCQFMTFLQEQLLDVVLVEWRCVNEEREIMRARIEFPGMAKGRLDTARLAVAPTLDRHHRLRIVDSEALQRAEDSLQNHPEQRGRLAGKLYREAILEPLERSGIFRLEHVRPSGKAMRPREGTLTDVGKEGNLVFKRTFFKSGRYDGLDLPMHPGDSCLTEVIEGAWSVKHTYFNSARKVIGEYHNINTPVEVYPYGARYVDLEVDVVRRASEPPILLDREKLAFLTREGIIAPSLEQKALETAEQLMGELQQPSRHSLNP